MGPWCSAVVETRCLAWVLLYPHSEARVVISVAGRRHTVPDPGVNGPLRVVDQTALPPGERRRSLIVARRKLPNCSEKNIGTLRDDKHRATSYDRTWQ